MKKPNIRSQLKSKKKKLHTRSECLSQAQKLCKLQMLDKYGRIFCITCNSPLEYGTSNCQGGHFWSRSERATETEPDNLHPQCYHCNVGLMGNHPLYEIKLRMLIGNERVERLNNMVLARRGDNDALNRLSPKDRVLATVKKTARYYDELWHELNTEIKFLESKLGV